ncbi:MAG: TonB-dependent receptor [Paludibacteraceae bacterium]|nr:TonB-dependent receptor [Paludibacteraceae bacterium]
MKENQSKFSSFKRLWFIMLLSCIGALTSFAQERTVTGTVLDDMGEPAIGATVKVPGTGIGTMTDMDGNYSLKVPSDASQLEFSYMGMETQTLPITGGKIDIKLGQSSKQLEEVVVTGYGTTKKRDVVTSVASVGADQIKNIPVTNAAEALQGKLTGVYVTTTEGSPDADVKIRVRGGSSLTQSSDPLYIVDGMPVASINDISPSDIQSMDVLKDAAATAIYGAQGANGVIIITTKEIDTSDGKDDCSMQFHVDYTGYMGWKSVSKKYDVLNKRDLALMQYEYAYLSNIKDLSKIGDQYRKFFDKDYSLSNGTIETPIATLLNDSLNSWFPKTTDWQDKTFGKDALTSNHSFSISGGNKKASFNMSYNRIDDEGIMRESDYTRNNFNLKASYKPFKGFKIGTNVRYTNTTVLGAGTNTAEDAGSKSNSRIENAIVYSPIALLSKDNESDDEDSYGNLYDPLTTIRDNYKFKRDNKWDIGANVSYNFLKKFTARVDLGYRAQNTETNRYYGTTTYYARDSEGVSNQQASNVYGIKTFDNSSRFRQGATFNYKDKYKGGHNLDVLVGEEIVMNKGVKNVEYGYGYEKIYDGENLFKHFGEYSSSSFEQYIDPTDNMLSFFAKAQYDYKGRYYLTATVRADASTRFSKENQWGYFPAAALAWRISDEPWMQSFNRAIKLSNLKLRFSYGVAGNNNVDLGYLRPDFVLTSAANSVYLSPAAFDYPTSFYSVGGTDKIAANPDLKWETTTTRDLGLDYGFFQDRLSGALDLYWNNTDDLIILLKTPAFYNYQYKNVAETKNLGVEFSVKGVILDNKSKNLNYDLTVDANISANKNTVVSLGGMSEYYVNTRYLSSDNMTNDAQFLVQEDKSVGRILGFEADGYYTAADFDAYNVTKNQWEKYDENGVLKPVTNNMGINNLAYPGLIKVKDLNGDGQITIDDRTVIGCTMPDFTGGFSISGHVGGERWGSVDAALNFTYSYGNDVLNLSGMKMSMIASTTKLRNTLASTAYGSRYSLFTSDGLYIPSSLPTSGDYIADYANLQSVLDNEYNSKSSTYNPSMGKSAVTSECVEDGSFLRLASMTIGYSLPDRWISKAHITKARIFFTASNLFVLTKYTGSDPEVDTGTKVNPLAIGVDYSAYPKSRAFNFGVNLSF